MKLIWNNRKYINYKHFANTKGTVYGNGGLRDTQVENGWEPLPIVFGSCRKEWPVVHVPEINHRLVVVLQHAGQ
jgi:hypothetical protein